MLSRTEQDRYGEGMKVFEKLPEPPPNVMEPVPPEPPVYIEELERPRKPESKLEYSKVRHGRTGEFLYTEVRAKHGHALDCITLRDFDPKTGRCRVAIITKPVGGRPKKGAKSNGTA